uniref:Macaca fascicularis brain cDNA, clone: QbsA-10364 n=1 Tax=Macaca fascicularis TaxID=9541 RepID=I7GKB3_MACFA|nr:unnamed protein product [Macaca fascicularis]
MLINEIVIFYDPQTIKEITHSYKMF